METNKDNTPDEEVREECRQQDAQLRHGDTKFVFQHWCRDKETTSIEIVDCNRHDKQNKNETKRLR